MEWISVKDRLPEIGDEYNVVWELNDGLPPVTTTMEFDFKAKQFIDKETMSNETDNILYWMPLPKPPIKL